MARHIWPARLALLAAAGCFTTGPGTTPVAVGPGPSSVAQPSPARVAHAPASEEAAVKVAEVGRKLVATNPSLGLRPTFTTVGAPKPEVFHRGDSEVLITEGLARQCRTEGELAAVLAHELGRMVAQRGALAAAVPDRGPPDDVPVGRDAGGAFGPADGTHLMELTRYEERRKRREEARTPPPPADLARAYLRKAGYAPA